MCLAGIVMYDAKWKCTMHILELQFFTFQIYRELNFCQILLYTFGGEFYLSVLLLI